MNRGGPNSLTVEHVADVIVEVTKRDRETGVDLVMGILERIHTPLPETLPPGESRFPRNDPTSKPPVGMSPTGNINDGRQATRKEDACPIPAAPAGAKPASEPQEDELSPEERARIDAKTEAKVDRAFLKPRPSRDPREPPVS